MRLIKIILILCFGIPITITDVRAATFYSDVATGNWHQPGSWTNNAIPGSADSVQIVDSDSISLTSSGDARHVAISNKSTLTIGNRLNLTDWIAADPGTRVNLTTQGYLSSPSGNISNLQQIGNHTIDVRDSAATLNVTEATTLGYSNLTKTGPGTLAMTLNAASANNNYTLQEGTLQLRVAAGSATLGRFDVAADGTTLKIAPDGIATVGELAYNQAGGLNLETARTNFAKTSFNAAAGTAYSINSASNVDLGELVFHHPADNRFIKQGAGNATIGISDAAIAENKVQLITQEGQFLTQADDGSAAVSRVRIQGGGFGATPGNTVTILDELRIDSGVTYSPTPGVILAASAEERFFEDSVLDLTNENGLQFSGTLGNGKGTIRYSDGGFLNNTMDGNIFVEKFSYVKNTSVAGPLGGPMGSPASPPLGSGGLQITAAVGIDIDNMTVSVSADGGPLTWNGDTAAPIVTTQGGTVKFEQRNPLESMTGITYHLDASQIALNDGDNVATWTDLSANGNDFVQGNVGNQPSYASSVANLNGMPAVYFNMSTDDELRLDTGSIEGNGTVIIVGIMRGAENEWGGGIWGGYNGTASGDQDFGIRIRYKNDAGDPRYWDIVGNGGNSYMGNASDGYIYLNGTIEADGRNWSNGGVSSQTYYMGEGNNPPEPTSFLMMASRGSSRPAGYERTSLGGYWNGRDWEGYMAEVICFDAVLDIDTATMDADLQQIGYYLTEKYGLPADPRYAGAPIDTSIVNLVIEPGSGAGVTPETTIDVSEIPEFIASNPIPFRSLTVNTGGTLRFSNGTLNTAEDVGSVTADFLAGTGGTVTLAGTDLTLGGALAAGDSHTYPGVISGTGSALTKVGDGTQILTGTNTYDGTTTINAGTLQLGNGGTTGTVTGDVVVAAGGTLALSRSDEHTLADVIGGTYTGTGTVAINNAATGATVVTGDLGSATEVNSGTLQIGDGTSALGTITPGSYTFNTGSTLALNLPAGGLPDAGFDLASATLRLRGSYAGYTTATLPAAMANLTVDAGTELTVILDSATPATAPVTATGLIALNGASLTIDAKAIAASMTNKPYLVLDGGSLTRADSSTPWSEADTDAITMQSIVNDPSYYWQYEVTGRDLTTTLKMLGPPEDTTKGVTNPEALATILSEVPTPGSPTAALQAELLTLRDNGATNEQLDRIVQQYTVSMAAARFAQSVTSNREILRQIGMQLDNPWDVYAGPSLRGQNNYLDDDPSRGYSLRDRNAWFQMFGWGGSQETKEAFAGYDASGWGFATGFDKNFGGRLQLGMAYGYTDNVVESQTWETLLDTTADPSKSIALQHTMLAYGRVKIDSYFFATGKIGGSYAEINGTRRPTNSTAATYETSASSFLMQGMLGCKLIRMPIWRVTPKVGLSFFQYNQKGYNEIIEGGTSEVSPFNDSFGEFELLLDSVVQMTKSMNFYTTVGYRGVVGAQGATLRMRQDGLPVYSVNGIAPANNVFIMDLGMDILFMENLSFLAEYSFRYGDGGSQLHGGTGTLVWKL